MDQEVNVVIGQALEEISAGRPEIRKEISSMNFAYTILYVDDVAETLTFYSRAFGFERKMLHEGGDYGELDTGATTLAFSSRKLMESLGKSPSRPDPSAPSFEIALTTEEVGDAVARALRAGASLVQDAEKMPWGQTVAYVLDNSGYLVEICTPVGDQQ